MISQIKILCPDESFLCLQAIEFLWNTIKISSLPAQSKQKQLKILNSMNNCNLYMSITSKLFVCFYCCLKNPLILNQKIAYNCIDESLICTCCGNHVTSIEMIGKFFTLYNLTYYLCTSCLKPTIYNGTTFDICENCIKKPTKRSMSCCYFCHKKTHEITHKVLNIKTLTIEYIPLCFNHAKTCITSCSTTYDMDSLEKEFGSKYVK